LEFLVVEFALLLTLDDTADKALSLIEYVSAEEALNWFVAFHPGIALLVHLLQLGYREHLAYFRFLAGLRVSIVSNQFHADGEGSGARCFV